MAPSRRSVLATSAALLGLGTAGCQFAQGTSKGATDVELYSVAAEPVTVAITVNEAGADEARFSREYTLAPTERAVPTEEDGVGKLPVGTDYAVTVAVDDGPKETYEWEGVTLELAPLIVLLDGSDNVHFALKTA